MSNKNQRHPQCANAHTPSAAASGMMISLTLCYKSKQPRPVKLNNMLEFNTVENMREVLNDTLSIVQDFVQVPEVLARCGVLHFKPGDHIQNKMCPEQDAEELIFMFDMRKSMVEILELRDSPLSKARVEALKGWCKCHWKDQWTWESKDSKPKWSYGSAKRAQSVPVTLAERRTNPVETARPWRDIGAARTDPEFLYPETPESPCPVSKNTQKLSKEEAKEYMQWIQSRIPDIDKKDARVYCAYCDMKNHPRWSCNRFSKHQNANAKHSCTLCIGEHPPFLCPRAQVNNGIARPHWARRETKQALDQHRTPDLRWDPQGNLPPPAEQPPAPMETSDPAQQEAAPEVTALLCAAAVAMHGPPPSTSHPTSSMRPPPAACPSVPEDREWTEQRHFPVPGRYVSGNLWNLDIPTLSINPGPMGSLMRHVTTMLSPTNPSYVTTRQWPVPSINQLRTDPTLENIAAHQAYLEKLQFEQNSRSKVMGTHGARSNHGRSSSGSPSIGTKWC